jgi:Ca2+-binding RTX toxin-like protein
LAFTTIPGASATDATSFIGTEGVDILSSIDVITALVEGLGFSDTITATTAGLAGTNNLTDWTVRGGTGQDTLNLGGGILDGPFGGDIVGGLFNGNQGSDKIRASRIFGGARILGGMDNDDIQVDQVFSSSVNGNKGTDKVKVSFGLVNGSVFGGQGADTITVGSSPTTDGIESSLISGDFGSDTITVTGTLYGSSTIEGGEGNDTITATSVEAATGFDVGLIINGGVGDDTITGGATNDTISGGEGLDSILGGDGADTISGGVGNDTISGGDGIDVITGGEGADLFLGKSKFGGTIDAPTWDKIVDFKKNVDFLDITYTAYTTKTFATVTDLLKEDFTGVAAVDLNVAVGTEAAGFSSVIVTTVAGKVDTIAQLGADSVFDAQGAQYWANIDLPPA